MKKLQVTKEEIENFYVEPQSTILIQSKIAWLVLQTHVDTLVSYFIVRKHSDGFVKTFSDFELAVDYYNSLV